jgi:hypothetical protein
MRKRISFILFPVLISLLILSACGGGPSSATGEEASAEPTATFTPDPKFDLEIFTQALTESLAAHDYDRLMPLIGNPFSLASIGTGSSTLPTAELVKRMQSRLLPDTSRTPVFLPDADIASILGPSAPTTLGPGLIVVRILYSQGWGDDGKGEAVLYISELPDKSFAWYGMLFDKDGFAPAEETEPAEESPAEVDRSDLESFKQALLAALSDPARTPDSLLPLMNDPFVWAGWQSEGSEQTPADVMPYLTDALPVPEAILYNTDTSLSDLLAGQDPQAIFPSGVDFMHMAAWGADGSGEAILIIGQGADGLYTWSGVLNAPMGFVQ